MGHHLRKLARGAARETLAARRKEQLRKDRFVAFMQRRWAELQKRFPGHRFYVGGVLPEDAPKVRAEGARVVVAAPLGQRPSFQGWWELVPLEEMTTTDSGAKTMFGIRAGNVGELVPIKLHPDFRVEPYQFVEKKAIVEPERVLIATPEEALQEMK